MTFRNGHVGSSSWTNSSGILNLFRQGKGISKFSSENDTPSGADQQVTRDPRLLQFIEFQAQIRERVEIRFSF